MTPTLSCWFKTRRCSEGFISSTEWDCSMGKILILANNAGGLFRFRGMLMKKLMEQGNDVLASVPYDDNVPDLQKMGVQIMETPINRRGINPKEDIALLFTYFRMIKTIKPSYVITYTVKPNVYGGFACRMLNIPYAANITGLGTAFQSDGLLRKIVTVMYKIGLKNAKTVFFENSENRDIFVKEGITLMGKTCLLNGAGVDLERFSYKPYPYDDGTTRFLFIGRVMKEKGVDELFAAMRMLQKDGIPCSVDVLGGFDEDYSKQIEACENEGWLRYHGVQSDVRPFIEKCHCFVLPSWHEGMANTNLESAASGRPVITSNIPGCMEAVEDGVTGFLCEKQNVDSLYETMKRFCTLSIEERKTMGLSGRKRMEAVFDKRKVVEETIRHLSICDEVPEG